MTTIKSPEILWHEVQIESNALEAEKISDQLIEYGAEAVTFQDGSDQPIYEPTPGTLRIWEKTIVTGLFSINISLDGLLENIAKENKITIKEIADENWIKKSLVDFKPLCFGERLWICPSWERPPNPHAVNLLLDPGLAFGTGTHPTTALCLRWLDQNDIKNKTVLDYGCGSGILGLAALKLGAKSVLAVDYDEQALIASESNAAQNQLYSPVFQTALPKQVPDQAFDLIISNILAEPLIELAPIFEKLAHENTKIVLSGILADQVPAIFAAYQDSFMLYPPTYELEWARISGSRVNKQTRQ